MVLADKNIPEQELSIWKDAEQVNTQRNIRLSWKLIECIELLTDNSIDCLVLKGPVFAIQAFGDLSKRQFSDLDILIHRADFSTAYDMLVQSGYHPAISLENKQKCFLLKTDNHFSFRRQEDIIEIHWDISPKENIHPLSSLIMWQGVDSIQLYEKNVETLSLKNTIFFMCMHGAKHCWNQLKWIVDLAYICKSLSENTLLTIIEQARQIGLFRQVSLGLLLAKQLVDLALPYKIMQIIEKDSQIQALVSQVKENMFVEAPASTQIESYIFYLRTRERWQDRLLYLIDIIFLPKTPDWLAISLPESLFFLYFLIRPIRLLYNLIRPVTSVSVDK